MKLFAIADLHLSRAREKSMNIFGGHWDGHWEKIVHSWKQQIQEQDFVLIPGDISWAMTMEDALLDLRAIGELPGTKLLLRGNHDYYWSSIGRLRASLPPGMYALQNDHFVFEGLTVCGTRGWSLPGSANFGAADQKIYDRELQRLKLSLASAEEKGLGCDICMMHFPPFLNKPEGAFVELLQSYGVKRVIYGHLHGRGREGVFEGEAEGIFYQLVSCDHLDFKPLPIVLEK